MMVNAGAVSEGCLKRVPKVRRVSFKDTAEADSTDTAFQGHATPNFALPGARALN